MGRFAKEPEVESLGGFLEHSTIIFESLEAAVRLIEYLIIKYLAGVLDIEDELLDLVLVESTCSIDIQERPFLIDLLLKVIKNSLIAY